MQVNEQAFLRMAEESHRLVFFDIESTGLKGDYNSVWVVSFKPYGKSPYSIHVEQAGNDQKVVRRAKEELERYDCWVSYYGKGFDIPMLNTRLLKWGQEPIEKRPHLDLYWTLKANLLTARRSQAHLLEWLETPQQKLTIGADTWNQMLRDFNKTLSTMVHRCESDTKGLEALYKKTKHLVREIKR